ILQSRKPGPDHGSRRSARALILIVLPAIGPLNGSMESHSMYMRAPESPFSALWRRLRVDFIPWHGHIQPFSTFNSPGCFVWFTRPDDAWGSGHDCSAHEE